MASFASSEFPGYPASIDAHYKKEEYDRVWLKKCPEEKDPDFRIRYPRQGAIYTDDEDLVWQIDYAQGLPWKVPSKKLGRSETALRRRRFNLEKEASAASKSSQSGGLSGDKQRVENGRIEKRKKSGNTLFGTGKSHAEIKGREYISAKQKAPPVQQESHLSGMLREHSQTTLTYRKIREAAAAQRALEHFTTITEATSSISRRGSKQQPILKKPSESPERKTSVEQETFLAETDNGTGRSLPEHARKSLEAHKVKKFSPQEKADLEQRRQEFQRYFEPAPKKREAEPWKNGNTAVDPRDSLSPSKAQSPTEPEKPLVLKSLDELKKPIDLTNTAFGTYSPGPAFVPGFRAYSPGGKPLPVPGGWNPGGGPKPSGPPGGAKPA